MKQNLIQIVTLLLCLVLLITVISQGRELDDYKRRIDDRIDMLQSQLSSEISAVSYHVDAALEEQASQIQDYFLEPMGVNAQEKALCVLVSVSLKEWSEDTRVELLTSLTGEDDRYSLETDGSGSYTAQLLLPLESDREIEMDVLITSQNRTRQEALGSWGNLIMLLPLQNTGGGWSGPNYQDGCISSNFTIYIEGREHKPSAVLQPQFLVYRNGELVQTLDAVEDPFSDSEQGYCFTVATEDHLWQLECAAEDVIDIRFRCRDEFGLGYDFLFATWQADSENPYGQTGAEFQSGSSELELFW